MTIIDTCGTEKYNPLIPAVLGICQAENGEKIKVIMDNENAFSDLKEYLSEQNVGFREIYDGEKMTLQFTVIK